MQQEAIREARGLQRKLKITSLPVPLDRIAKHFGAKVTYSILEDGVSGLLYKKGGKTVIGVNALHPETRQRFTIAHELAHLVLHQGDIFVDKGHMYRDSRSGQGIDQKEIDANAFAAELLMPEDLVRKELASSSIDLEDQDELAALAEKFDVSMQALTIRLKNLGIFGFF